MIDDSAINYAIAKIFDFHFGTGFRDDLFDPGKDDSLSGHGAGSSRFLHD